MATPLSLVSAVLAAGDIVANDEGDAEKVTTLLTTGLLFPSSTVAEALTIFPSDKVLVVEPVLASVKTMLTVGFK